jgi:hypothetical protein
MLAEGVRGEAEEVWIQLQAAHIVPGFTFDPGVLQNPSNSQDSSISRMKRSLEGEKVEDKGKRGRMHGTKSVGTPEGTQHFLSAAKVPSTQKKAGLSEQPCEDQ